MALERVWMGNACCTDIMLHSSVSYHQEHALQMALEPRRLHKDDLAACSAAIPRFHGVFSLGGVLICVRVRCVSQAVPPTRVRWCLSFGSAYEMMCMKNDEFYISVMEMFYDSNLCFI
jgi:hypothetical protein